MFETCMAAALTCNRGIDGLIKVLRKKMSFAQKK